MSDAVPFPHILCGPRQIVRTPPHLKSRPAVSKGTEYPSRPSAITSMRAPAPTSAPRISPRWRL